MRIRGAAVSNIGARRVYDEDVCFVQVDGDMALAVVADAMGGRLSGRPASDVAIAIARDRFERRFEILAEVWWEAEHGGVLPESERRAIATHLRALHLTRKPETQGDVAVLAEDTITALARSSVSAGNAAIWRRATTDRFHRGEGTTIELAVFDSQRVGLAHVGDSRTYRVRDGALTALTRDHSLLNDYLSAMPELTEDQIAELPQNVITRALGMQEIVAADTSLHELASGDRFLFCSDGLWRQLPEEALLATIQRHGVDAARALVDEVAPEADDNVTAVVVEIR